MYHTISDIQRMTNTDRESSEVETQGICRIKMIS